MNVNEAGGFSQIHHQSLKQAFCWFGLVFFSGFSLLFLGRCFLGLGG